MYKNKTKESLASLEEIEKRIFYLRGKKIMLDSDLAELYGVETKNLNRAVRRNIERFPEEFMFELTSGESKVLRCQIGTLKRGQHKKYLPLAFTEHGVAMLSSVLRSKKAVQVNIQIIKAFIQIREMLSNYKGLRLKLEVMEQKYDHQFKIVFDTMKKLIDEEEKPKNKIGFDYEGAE